MSPTATIIPDPTVAPSPTPTQSLTPVASPTALPAPTSTPTACQYSGTGERVIKGNIGIDRQKIYHVPDSRNYDRTTIDESKGERWFCTVEEAIAAGWRAPLRSIATPTPVPITTAISDTPTTVPSPRPIPTPSPTPTRTLYASAFGKPDVQIACIFFDGVAGGRAEPDEYVEIVNLGDAAQDMAGWTLMDVTDGKPTFPFPSSRFERGVVPRVYTNEDASRVGRIQLREGLSHLEQL